MRENRGPWVFGSFFGEMFIRRRVSFHTKRKQKKRKEGKGFSAVNMTEYRQV